jgi:hypothetical protein
VKARRHDPIRRIECLFHAISVMHVHVDIEDTRVDAEEFEDAQDA